MAVVSNTVNYLDGGVLLQAFFAYDDSFESRRPAVLICHDMHGKDNFIECRAKQLARVGYFSFAIDMYGVEAMNVHPEKPAILMQSLLDDRRSLQKRVYAGLYAVTLLPWVDDHNIAAVGFGFGGGCALDLARMGANIKGAVSLDGLLDPPPFVSQDLVKAKIFALQRYGNPSVNTRQANNFLAEMSDLKVDWKLHYYGEVSGDSSEQSKQGLEGESVVKQCAWQSTVNFLSDIFI